MKKVLGIYILLLLLTFMPASGVSATGFDSPACLVGAGDSPTSPPPLSSENGGDGEEGKDGDPDDWIEGNRLDGSEGGQTQGVGPRARILRGLVRLLLQRVVWLPR